MSSSNSNSSFSTTTTLSLQLDHLFPSDHLCYVHCNICDTVLAVSVPCSSVFKTLTVRCGHCTNLLPVNMNTNTARASALLFPTPMNQFHLGPNLFAPSHHLITEESLNLPCSNMLMMNKTCSSDFMMTPHVGAAALGGPDHDHHRHLDQLVPIRPPVINKPPEKRQRVPSAYNRFVKEEIQRIKAENPDISHREAFGAAAKNWAHFPHIHFGLMTQSDDHSLKKTNILQQEGENIVMKDGFFGQANVGVTPY